MNASKVIVALAVLGLSILSAIYLGKRLSADRFTERLIQKNPEIYRRLAES